jgi:hypothetical protein
MQKIDLVKLREDVRANYANYPQNGDKVSAFEQRNAELIADLCVAMVRESVEIGTAPGDLLQGLTAMFSIPLENMISEYRMQPRAVIAFVGQGLDFYLVQQEGVTPDAIVTPRRDVGDA